MTEFNITIPGEVVGKQYKIITIGKWPKQHASLTTTPKSKTALNRYREAVKVEAMQRRWESLDCPVDVRIAAFIAVRPSYSTKKTQALLSGPCAAKPDPDNIAKMVLDALVGPKVKYAGFQTYEKVIIDDDKQVTDLNVTKRWCEIGQERLEVTVTPVVWDATLI